MRTCFAILLLILSAMRGLAADDRSSRVGDAEKVAQEYMTAFFHSDLRTAASLTYPETLQQIKNAFMQERAAAVAAGREPGFLSNSGITDPANLDALGLADFYAAVVSGSRRSQPDFVTAMKVAVVAVKSSERTDSEHAIVTLAITVPTGAGTHTQDTRLSLVFVDGQWKVVGNVK